MRLLIVSLYLFVYTQAFNQKFVATEKEWSSSTIPNPINPEFRKTTYFFADSLSMLNGVEYRRLMEVDELGNVTGNRKYFREENGIVYSRNYSHPEEVVNYDFNMSIGDSIRYLNSRFLVVSDISVSYTHLTLPTTPYV